MSVYPVIMCGGSGTRLWPASSPARPKQFIPLTGPRSSFQETVLRLSGLKGAEAPVIVAGIAHGEAIRGQLEEIGVKAVVLLEPEARDSAAAMAAAGVWIARRDPTGIAVVLSADHEVPDAEAFCQAVAEAVVGAEAGRIVTLGVKPASPSPAYGYIRPGPGEGVRAVEAFVEKPGEATARTYVREGYLWNSGNFVLSAAVLQAELQAHAPEVLAAARAGVEEAGEGDVLTLGPSFRTAPKISIDYAVMERTQVASVLPVDFIWSDVGAWDAVLAVSPQDDEANSGPRGTLFEQARGNLVRAPQGSRVAVVGLENVGVIIEGQSVLVLDLTDSQLIKTVADRARTAPALGAFADLPSARQWYETWLMASALPLWWTLGADHARGGFRDSLSTSGQSVPAPRRARVQARQAYVYATAGMLGWSGPWQDAVDHALNGFTARFRRPDGLFRTQVSETGEVLDETAMVYDQAFALLALGTAYKADRSRRGLVGIAAQTREGLESLRHPAGGFREAIAWPSQANCHMHLLEAALAWAELGEPGWDALADELVTLALTRFIDADAGFLREFFSEDWTPAPGVEGRIVEPGHQFEWAWLLERWGILRNRDDARAAARTLFEHGIRGVDPARSVAVNALWDDGSVKDGQARLWPQTEYIKAALILDRPEHTLAGLNGLRLYLETPAPGVWFDKLEPNGRFVDEPAPASSFYHIMLALEVLRASA